jgi:glutathione-regulated potassium-efflux system ancillary protein KefG
MGGMKRVLVLFAHPALRRSRVNRRLIAELKGVDGVFVNDLYEQYPDLDIDVDREQRLLLEHEVVVLQHPLYWYSTPAILKEWQDLVLEHGWAYGHEGRALVGKLMMSAITTGATEESYCRDGSNRFGVRELLTPIEQTARMCGMDYLSPFVVHGTHRLAEHEIASHAADYRRTLEALRDDRIDLGEARRRSRLNEDLATVVRA